MSVKVECDRCGAQEKTSGVMLFAGFTGPSTPTARPELPDGWTRPTLPHEDGSAWKHELCPQCKADLIRFMAGQPVIDDSELASQVMRIAPPKVCRGCGHHRGEGCGCPPDRTCPGCGHLRHSLKCTDPVFEVGPCGCKELTPSDLMEELGIDD